LIQHFSAGPFLYIQAQCAENVDVRALVSDFNSLPADGKEMEKAGFPVSNYDSEMVSGWKMRFSAVESRWYSKFSLI